jgi:plasmid replication initiation protein
MNLPSLKDEYVKVMANHILVTVDDLTPNERKLIDESFTLFKSKLEDIKILNDEVKRLSIELANLKSMQDDKDYLHDEEE